MSSPKQSTTAASSATSERRRSSGSNGGLFNNLLSQKRSPENVAYSQRRQSIEDQGPRVGVFGQMWNNAVRGAGPSSPK